MTTSVTGQDQCVFCAPEGGQDQGFAPARRIARRIGGWAAGCSAMLVSLAVAADAMAASGKFKSVPGAAAEGGGSDDMILGLVSANTLFFICAGVFAVFWFIFGGGRKPKVGREGH